MEKDMRHGHRERMREAFLKDGNGGNLPDYQIMEMLLFYAIPRKDTRSIAHRLIKHFGSFSAVFDAPISELVKVEGISQNSAILFKIVMAVGKQYSLDRQSKSKFFNLDEIGNFLIEQYAEYKVEVLSMISLSAAGKFLSFDIISKGETNTVTANARKIMECVVNSGAKRVVLAHNHPSGIAVPSMEDVKTTCEISELLSKVDVKVVDHIVLDSSDFVSMAQSKEYDYIF